MTNKQPLTVLIIYDTHEFGSALAHALERLNIALPPELAERHALFTWLAGGHCYKQNEARRTMKALDGLGHAVHIADIRDLRLNSANDLLLHKGRPVDLSGFDAAWLRLAGRHDKSWLVPAAPGPAYFGIIDHIERRLPVITPFAKAVAMDGKVETQRFLERHNIPSPRSLTLTQAEESGGGALDARIDAFMNAYPPGAFFVLKKDRGSMGHRAPYRKTPNAWDNFQSEIWGIFIHDDPALVRGKLKKWLQAPSSKGVVLQEFIPSVRKERRVVAGQNLFQGSPV